MDRKQKQKETMKRFEKMMAGMSDRELENLLLIGEGMVIMSGIKETGNFQKIKHEPVA